MSLSSVGGVELSCNEKRSKVVKYFLKTVSITLGLVIMNVQLAAAAATKMPSGFYYPTPLIWTGSGDTQQPPGQAKIFGWLATDQDNPPYPVHNSHRGIDIYGASGSDVYAMTSGTIATNGTGTSDYLNKNLWVKHDLAGGGFFYAVYGHVNSSLSAGTKVTAGQKIATVASQNNPHVHLGIHPAGVSYPWGRGPIPSGWSIKTDPDKSELPLDGWVAPRAYLETHTPPGAVTVNQPNIALTMTCDRTTANPGDVITYNISYKNSGAGSASNVVLSAPVPANSTYISGSGGTLLSGSIKWTVSSLASGGTGSVSFQVKVN
jgi:uncharacterized repeat protein (TIGR01451 family)